MKKEKMKIEWSYIEDLKSYYAYYDGEELGYIEYYKKWKKWVWNQIEDIIMSESCLQNVIDKLKELENEKQRNN